LNKRDLSGHGDDQAATEWESADGKPVDEDGASPKASWNQSKVFRFVGMGTELAGFTLVVAGLGYLLDRIGQNPKPYGTALGALIGFSLGMVRFIQQARTSDD
jgi:F0F1-type ATP synthase assembly protein I